MTSYRKYFGEEVIGIFDDKLVNPNPKTRLLNETDSFISYEVVLDVFGGSNSLFAYGILTVPKDITKNGKKRPVVVCQHGLEGRPQSTIGEKEHHYYKAFSTELAKLGFVTFAPQNIYIFQDRFRALQFKAKVQVQQGEKTASADSVMALLMLASNQGKEVTVTAEGEDEEQALNAICELVSNRFDESE